MLTFALDSNTTDEDIGVRPSTTVGSRVLVIIASAKFGGYITPEHQKHQ
jgi:hypothetical protein